MILLVLLVLQEPVWGICREAPMPPAMAATRRRPSHETVVLPRATPKPMKEKK